MLDPTTIEKLDRYWSSDFGCSLDEYLSDYHAQKHAGELKRKGYSGIFSLTRSNRTTISIPPEWFDRISQLLPASPGELAKKLQSTATAVIGPAYTGYSQIGPPPLEGARAIDEEDFDAWSELREACPPLEWAHGGSELHQVCSGVFSSERLIALSAYKIWGGFIAHISIVTHPDFRGNGQGRRAVAHLMNRAIADGLLPQYRTLESNTPSIHVASALGFTRYATTLAINLPAPETDTPYNSHP